MCTLRRKMCLKFIVYMKKKTICCLKCQIFVKSDINWCSKLFTKTCIYSSDKHYLKPFFSSDITNYLIHLIAIALNYSEPCVLSAAFFLPFEIHIICKHIYLQNINKISSLSINMNESDLDWQNLSFYFNYCATLYNKSIYIYS